MGLSKYQLHEDADSISSWLKDGSGNAIGSTAGALDVNVASGNLTVDLSHTEDSVRLGDGTAFYTSTTVGADIGLDVNLINASIAVTATDLDIRDLLFATDKVDVSGSSVTVSATDLDIRNLLFATDKVDVSGSSVTVSATDLDIRDLSAAQDSVSSWLSDGSGNAISSSTGFLDVFVKNAVATTPAGYTSGAYGANSVTTVVGAITAGTASRDKVLLQNLGNQDFYVGFDNSVTIANGIKIPKGGSYEMEVSDGVTLFGITASGTADLRYQEMVA